MRSTWIMRLSNCRDIEAAENRWDAMLAMVAQTGVET